MRKILFASFNEANFPAAETLLRPLKSKGASPMIVPGFPPPSPGRLEGWETFFWERSEAGKEKAGREILEKLNPRFKAYLIHKFGGEKVLEYLEAWVRIGDFTERIILRESPDLIVLSPGSAESFYIQEICRRRSLNYCFLMPVFYEFKTTEFFDIQPVPYLVAGEAGRQRLIQKGADPEKVFVTGNAIFEGLFKFRGEPFLDARSAGKRILFAAQGGRMDEIIYGLLTRYLTHRPEASLTVRPHPTENPALWSRRARGFKAVTISNHDKLLNRDLLESDVLVTASSACVLNAFVLGIPALSFKGGLFPEETIFAREGDVLCAENYRELQEGLERILFEKDFREAWIHDHRDSYKKYLSPENENAAGRIAELLTRIASQTPVMT